MAETVRIAETFTLPSKGLLYDTDVNPEVTLCSMKTKHEMLRLSSTDDTQKIMADIIDDCIVGDIGISAYDLCLGDFQFLLYKLRIVTFGNDYDMSLKCPYCGFEHTTSIDLDELEVKEFKEELVDMMEVTLPKSGNVISLTMQTPRLIDKSQQKAKEYKRRRKNSNENAVFLYTIMSSIDKIDGEKPNPITLEEWVKDLPMADTNALVNRIDELNNQIGFDMNMEKICPVCKTNIKFPFRINNSFFRPEN